MYIKEVCQACGLTKKAVAYYESQGLIAPAIEPNGYRNYSCGDMARLKEIAVLRHCGMGIAQIQKVLNSNDKAAELARYRHLSAIQIEKIQSIQERMDQLIQNYDINRAFDACVSEDDRAYTIREKLVMAFPGHYGIWLSLHFGSFLNIPMETQEQQAAYESIVTYLDEAPSAMPEELAGYLEEMFPAVSYEAVAKLHVNAEKAISTAIADPEAYFRENDIEEYLEYRLSDAFVKSPAGRMVELMLAFQKNSGYREVFIANMKKLSPAYDAYLTELEAMNAKFIEKYPQLKGLYPEGQNG